MSGATISTTAALLISAGVAAAGTASEMIYSAVSKPSAPVAPTQAQTNEQTAEASQASALAQAQALTQRRGMASTMLQSPMTSGNATVGKATLGA
jgi:hypothetical protein